MLFIRFSKTSLLVLAWLVYLFLSSVIVCDLDSITSSVLIKGPETISSSNNTFTLGFFSPQNSTNHYIGIWYMSKSCIVWVANRNKPLTDSSGILTVSKSGNLVILNGQNEEIWSTNVSHSVASNYSAQLLDSGNLVLADGITGTYVWQSFLNPSNTMLQDMELITYKKTGEKVQLTSWKSESDPSIGRFSLGLEVRNVTEIFLWEGNSPLWRSGPWNGMTFIGITRQSSFNSQHALRYSDDEESVRLSFYVGNSMMINTLVSQGNVERRSWNSQTHAWILLRRVISSACDVFGKCGPFGICNSQSLPICSCLRGFEPKNKQEWERQNWTRGCVRRESLHCERDKSDSQISDTDGFFTVQNVKVPDDAQALPLALYAQNATECQSLCHKNCSCIAYAHETTLGCMVWSADLLDIQSFSYGGLDIFIRLANSEFGIDRREITISIILSILIGTVLITVSGYFLWIKCSNKKGERKIHDKKIMTLKQAHIPELLLLSFRKLATATNNFDMANKLGEGGFGPVFKGILEDGQEIAVKKLSISSGQGMEEFINEVELISKLQHRNLVRLLGCCIEGEEILVYEYMPNKSLDAYIFDPLQRRSFDWGKRSNIIEGIARGLLYLHRDSRLRIIHRDLKASNILLDKEMNPKISDFGMAKLFSSNEDQANTKRIVGTYGYISPEYATVGLYSEKSDVFSFGVLLLEVVSGRKNTSFYEEEESLTLLGFAWKLWIDGDIVPLIDPHIYDSSFHEDIVRCIHIGLLCVQELARDRPTMALVMSMLKSEIMDIPPPSQPAFIFRQAMSQAEGQKLDSNELCSINTVSISNFQGR